MLALLLLFAENPKVPQELYSYLGKRDSSYQSSILTRDARGMTLQMTSQTWQGIPWNHTILIRQPTKPAAKGTGILYITGDGPREGDFRDLALIAEATGMPVAMLFNIPNQPLWEMREDDLIAHTFEKYLETGDASWPLLFPMTKSAIRAMDAVQKATRSTDNPIRRFVVTGASKRGWTTWFVGASKDKRVIGIAPMVYDNLNVAAQMPHQIKTWGAYSEMIQDYTRRGLQAKLETAKGRELARMIDPYSYLANVRVPTLIVNGSNDPYWAADATSLYWNDLRQPHWLLTVPNAGHDLAGGLLAAQGVGQFARSLAGEFRMPKVDATAALEGNVLRWRVRRPVIGPKDAVPTEARLWVAAAENLDFRPAKYGRLHALEFPEGTVPATVEATTTVPAGNLAVFVEVRYRANNRLFSLSTPTQIFKR